jgi:hypothetical protein
MQPIKSHLKCLNTTTAADSLNINTKNTEILLQARKEMGLHIIILQNKDQDAKLYDTCTEFSVTGDKKYCSVEQQAFKYKHAELKTSVM